jgi:hypothetical protein
MIREAQGVNARAFVRFGESTSRLPHEVEERRKFGKYGQIAA